jgi:hypothetical protein
MKSKRGQFQISFGMIFSIILIIAFIAVAFYVIKVFLGVKDCTQIGRLFQEVQDSVEKAYRSPETSDDISVTVPSHVEKVCIINLQASAKGPMSDAYDRLTLVNRNFVIYPKTECSDLGGIDLTKIDITSITSEENPFCIDVKKSKVNLRVEKGLYDKVVRITR